MTIQTVLALQSWPDFVGVSNHFRPPLRGEETRKVGKEWWNIMSNGTSES